MKQNLFKSILVKLFRTTLRTKKKHSFLLPVVVGLSVFCFSCFVSPHINTNWENSLAIAILVVVISLLTIQLVNIYDTKNKKIEKSYQLKLTL